MTATLDQVIEILEQSEGLYQRLVPIFYREKRAALSSDPRRLSAVTIEKEELLAQLGQLERRRINLVSQMADALKLPPSQMNLSVLAANADVHQAFRITRLRQSLGALINTVKQANAENRLLIQHCLDLARSAMCFFQHWMKPVSVYGSSGRMDTGKGSGKLVSGTI